MHMNKKLYKLHKCVCKTHPCKHTPTNIPIHSTQAFCAKIWFGSHQDEHTNCSICFPLHEINPIFVQNEKGGAAIWEAGLKCSGGGVRGWLCEMEKVIY